MYHRDTKQEKKNTINLKGREKTSEIFTLLIYVPLSALEYFFLFSLLWATSTTTAWKAQTKKMLSSQRKKNRHMQYKTEKSKKMLPKS